jgi:hypothetical protein
MNRIKSAKLLEQGYLELKVDISEILSAVQSQDWKHVDSFFEKSLDPDGYLFNYFKEFVTFNETEFIIAIRDAKNPHEEDGIWHDDGSRTLGFSLSLTEDPSKIEGGILELRLKNKKGLKQFSPFSYGTLVLFLTGQYNYEHKINKVSSGVRTIIAGWLS